MREEKERTAPSGGGGKAPKPLDSKDGKILFFSVILIVAVIIVIAVLCS